MSPRSATRLVVALVLLASCSGEEPCHQDSAAGADCADILFQGRPYNEWRPIRPPHLLQEVGDATYPACNTADASCSSDDSSGVAGFGATDVWQLGRVPSTKAVIGLREGTHTYVVFVAVGTDPRSLRSRLDPDRLG